MGFDNGLCYCAASRFQKREAATEMTLLAVDPGKKGGYVHFSEGFAAVESGRMPIDKETNEIDIPYLAEFICDRDIDLVVCEKNWVGKGSGQDWQDQGRMGVSGAFKYGFAYGMLIGLFRAYFIPLHLVAPITWKTKVLGSRKANKADAIQFTKTFYPSVDLQPGACRTDQDGIADAVCIAHYAIDHILNKPGKVHEKANFDLFLSTLGSDGGRVEDPADLF